VLVYELILINSGVYAQGSHSDSDITVGSVLEDAGHPSHSQREQIIIRYRKNFWVRERGSVVEHLPSMRKVPSTAEQRKKFQAELALRNHFNVTPLFMTEKTER
jgi:hypothetical protein